MSILKIRKWRALVALPAICLACFSFSKLSSGCLYLRGTTHCWFIGREMTIITKYLFYSDIEPSLRYISLIIDSKWVATFGSHIWRGSLWILLGTGGGPNMNSTPDSVHFSITDFYSTWTASSVVPAVGVYPFQLLVRVLVLLLSPKVPPTHVDKHPWEFILAPRSVSKFVHFF